MWNLFWGTTETDRELAEQAARKAVELDPHEAEAYLALGVVHYTNQEFDRSIREFEAALSLNPSYAAAHHNLATAFIHIGLTEEALPHLFTAIRLSPKDSDLALFYARLALAFLFLRRHEEAVEWGKKAVRLPGIQWPGHCFLVASLAHLDRMDEARKALADLLAFRPGITAQFIRDHYPKTVQSNFDHLLDGLRKAGLP